MSEPIESALRDVGRAWPGWCCSYCAAPLQQRPNGLYCAAEERFFATVDGVHRLLSEERHRETRSLAGRRPFPAIEGRDRMETALGRMAGVLGAGRWRLLQVGAGDCAVALDLVRLGHSVVAADVDLDSEHGLVAAGRDRAQAGRLVRVEADAEALPFEPATFDAVIAAGALHHVSIARALIELRRVTRSGGVLASWGSPVVRRRRGTEAEAVWVRDELPVLFRETGWRLDVVGWPSRPSEWLIRLLHRLKLSPDRPRFPLLLARRNG